MFLFWLFIISLIIYFILGIFERKNTKELVKQEGVRTENIAMINRIKNVNNAEELMAVVASVEEFCGEENSILLQRACYFEDDLSELDWADIYYVAEEDSMLAKVAQEKAGIASGEEEF